MNIKLFVGYLLVASAGLVLFPVKSLADTHQGSSDADVIHVVSSQILTNTTLSIKIYEASLDREYVTTISPSELKENSDCQLTLANTRGDFAKHIAKALESTTLATSSSNGIMDCRIGCEVYDADNKLLLSIYLGQFAQSIINGNTYDINNTLRNVIVNDLSAFVPKPLSFDVTKQTVKNQASRKKQRIQIVKTR